MRKQFIRHARCTLLFAATVLSAGAQADSGNPSLQDGSVYAGVSTFGLGVGYAHRFSDKWAARFTLNSGLDPKSQKEHLSGIDYDVKMKAGPGFSAQTDYYPIKDSGFRLSLGVNYSRIKGTLGGRPDNGSYSINGQRYSATQVGSLNGNLKYKDLHPFMGIGWESKPLGSAGWRFVSDLGVLYYGKAKTSLSASGATAGSALQRDIDAERNQLSKRGVGVSIGLGAAYAF